MAQPHATCAPHVVNPEALVDTTTTQISIFTQSFLAARNVDFVVLDRTETMIIFIHQCITCDRFHGDAPANDPPFLYIDIAVYKHWLRKSAS